MSLKCESGVAMCRRICLCFISGSITESPFWGSTIWFAMCNAKAMRKPSKWQACATAELRTVKAFQGVYGADLVVSAGLCPLLLMGKKITLGYWPQTMVWDCLCTSQRLFPPLICFNCEVHREDSPVC